MSYWISQVGRAGSRLLNAALGGEGDCTFSAWSWQLALAGSAWGRLRVAVVDALNREPGHCRAAWEWHAQRDLLSVD